MVANPSPINEVGTMLKEEEIRCGVSFLHHKQDCIKSIGFASDRRSNDLMDILINKDEILNHFIKYFEGEIADVLKNKDKLRVKFQSTTPNMHPESWQDKMGACFSEMKIKRFSLTEGNELDGPYLTKRELECLFLLCEGNSAKQVAHLLGVSPRTVDCHIKKCKEKFRVYNKFELVNRALRMGIREMCIIRGIALNKND